MSEKLTKPQRALLSEASLKGLHISPQYQPAVRLVALGLAEWRKGIWSDVFHATDSGRAALKSETATDE